jgi:nitroimidazol reductase NimA-like FMN-containing flavoprotein (pyridoxamine 5'-phosphate oxidase superfamily)
MLVHDLTEAQCHEILSRARLARLACSRGDQPYVVPVSFSYDARSNCLYCFSAVGKKIEWMRENPKVCAEIEDIQDRTHWSTVVVVGRYDEIGDAPEDRATRDRVLQLFQERAGQWWLPGAAKPHGTEPQAVVVYRIHIDRVTGRSADHTTG